MRVAAIALLVLSACSSSGSDSPSTSVVGSWKLTQGANAVYLDLREDKTCRYAVVASGTVACQTCTYTFGDGTLTLSFSGPPAQQNASKATVGAETMTLESNGTSQTYARATLPPDVTSTCK